MTDAIVIEHCGRGLYRIHYNSVASDPLPWFRITAKLVVAIMREYRDTCGGGK